MVNFNQLNYHIKTDKRVFREGALELEYYSENYLKGKKVIHIDYVTPITTMDSYHNNK